MTEKEALFARNYSRNAENGRLYKYIWMCHAGIYNVSYMYINIYQHDQHVIRHYLFSVSKLLQVQNNVLLVQWFFLPLAFYFYSCTPIFFSGTSLVPQTNPHWSVFQTCLGDLPLFNVEHRLSIPLYTLILFYSDHITDITEHITDNNSLCHITGKYAVFFRANLLYICILQIYICRFVYKYRYL